MNRIATHPGEVLWDEFMVPLGLGVERLAQALDVSSDLIASIIAEEHPAAVAPDMALRLSRYFGTTLQLWLNLQQAYDLSVAMAAHGAEINDAVRPRGTEPGPI